MYSLKIKIEWTSICRSGLHSLEKMLHPIKLSQRDEVCQNTANCLLARGSSSNDFVARSVKRSRMNGGVAILARCYHGEIVTPHFDTMLVGDNDSDTEGNDANDHNDYNEPEDDIVDNDDLLNDGSDNKNDHDAEGNNDVIEADSVNEGSVETESFFSGSELMNEFENITIDDILRLVEDDIAVVEFSMMASSLMTSGPIVGVKTTSTSL